MNSNIIDGKKIASEIKNEVFIEVEELKSKNIIPTLAVVIVGNDPASKVYVKNKKKACDETGILSRSFELAEETTETELLKLIDELNNDKNINGILIQLPLPNHINEHNVLLRISPEKDVDGFHPYNVGLLNIGNALLKPCTPSGIIELLKRSSVEISGKNCVIVGRSNIVGKPISSLLLSENGTVTITHSKTKNLSDVTSNADILIVAIGKTKFITSDMIKEDVVIIDVGINRDGKKLFGDVDFEDCKTKASLITPVPGGVGPMTIAMLMKNCLLACKSQHNL